MIGGRGAAAGMLLAIGSHQGYPPSFLHGMQIIQRPANAIKELIENWFEYLGSYRGPCRSSILLSAWGGSCLPVLLTTALARVFSRVIKSLNYVVFCLCQS